MKNINNDIRKIEDQPDGSSVYEIGPEVLPEQISSFSDNLAVNLLDDESLKRLANYLVEQIEQDVQASKPWTDSINRAKEVLGFDIEEAGYEPFPNASNTYDTTMASAVIRAYAVARAEVLQSSGPAGFQIEGIETEELEEIGEKRRDFLNNYLTVIDKPYYPDFERCLLYWAFEGCAFKKVYYDQLLKRPIARFILSEDFIIDGNCTSIIDSNRLTHVLHLSKREILLNQQNGVYRNIELSALKLNDSSLSTNEEEKKPSSEDFDTNAYEKPSLFSIYESHVYLNLDDFVEDNVDPDNESIPLPYIIVMEPNSKEILSIRRNWKENDPEKKRKNYFVQYNYLPGFGIRGLGLAHLLGSNAISLTSILRMLMDAGKFQNLPGGLRQKGIKQQDNNLIVGVGQWVEVNTGSIPLRDVFMPLPYSGPSQALLELYRSSIEQTKELGSISEMGMMDSREDIPAETAMAFLETNNRIQNASLKSLHSSLSEELQMLDELFRTSLGEDFSDEINGKQISAEDFTDEIKIIPISDPSTNSTVQRIMKARATLQIAMQAPEIHNLREVFKLNYTAQGLNPKEIEKLLPDPEESKDEVLSLDPVTENMNILMGKPVKAAIWQAHEAHIYLHGVFAQDNPDTQAEVMAHIKEHQAFLYMIKMQQLLGQELPPLESLESPEIQNTIAMNLANSVEAEGAGSVEENASIDPDALLMADIKQKEAETISREKIANLRAETDIFKAQLDFEKEKAKIESAEDIALLKSETELTKNEI